MESLLNNEDFDKYEICCQISAATWETDTEVSKKYASMAVEIAKSRGDEKKVYKAMRNYGMIYTITREYDNALSVFKDVLNYFEKIKDTSEIAALHRNIGDIQYRQAKYKEALEEYLYSEKLFQKLMNNKPKNLLELEENYGATLNNIGNVYLRLEDFDKSIKFFEQALLIQKKTGDTYSESAAYTNIGNIYYYMLEFDKSLENYHKALEVATGLDNYSLEANIVQNIASTYLAIKQNKKALKYYYKALDIFQKTDNADGILEIYTSLALAYMSDMNKDSASHYFKISENIARDIKDYQYLSYIQSNKADFYKTLGNLEKAFDYLKESQISKDSVMSIESREQINKLTVQYESEKKDNLIRIKNLEMDQKENEIYLMYLALGIVSISFAFIIWLYRNKNKNLTLIKEKNDAIEEANLELEQQNDFISKQNDELINLNAMKDKFFSIISHDMRNPVTNLSLLIDLAEAYSERGDYQQLPDKFRKFKISLQHLMSLFDNLLTWAKTQTGNIKFHKSNQNITAILSNLADSFALTSEVKNINFEFHAQKNIMLDADKDMLEFIVRNLLSNSFKFTNHGGNVILSVDENESSVMIKVKDDGIGLTEEEIDKLFMIHQKYSKSGTANEKGSGLGLTIVKEFVDLHQGSIEVNSKVNQGAEFIIKFNK